MASLKNAKVERLGCDCYPGCWGDHSIELGWYTVPCSAEIWDFAVKNFPYGSYVRTDYHKMHVSDPDLVRAIREFLSPQQPLVY